MRLWMMAMRRLLGLFVAQFLVVGASVAQAEAVPSAAPEAAPDPYALIAAAIDLNRGLTSHVEMAMRVHRPEWERRSALVSWTRGRTDALIRFTAPPRDAGNATLRNGAKMWTFTPKLNRVVRLPFSLMSQSWAGSDFSYSDLSRTDDVLNYYDLAIVEVTEDRDGRAVYRIDARPHDDAPVVWGKEEWVLRDDYIVLSQTFYDQDMIALKQLKTLEIRNLGGRQLAARIRMSRLDEAEHYTEMEYLKAEFDLTLPDSVFTTFNLQSGARGG
ncbi:MAG: outer membrane lipoprotein-sorting protein [Gammaproteobacteria bacterium]|nr:outer membrane lipoprotein-sorting protein [Gammaproteobacteria bacterium]